FFAHPPMLNGCLQILILNNCTPSLHLHYRNFLATISTSDAAYYITLPVAGLSNNPSPKQPHAVAVLLLKSKLLLLLIVALVKQPLTFRIYACVMLLPPQCRRTCNQ